MGRLCEDKESKKERKKDRKEESEKERRDKVTCHRFIEPWWALSLALGSPR